MTGCVIARPQGRRVQACAGMPVQGGARLTAHHSARILLSFTTFAQRAYSLEIWWPSRSGGPPTMRSPDSSRRWWIRGFCTD